MVKRDTSRLLEVHEVAKKLSCSHMHVLNMINRNQIKAKNIGKPGRRAYYRIKESEIIRFIE